MLFLAGSEAKSLLAEARPVPKVDFPMASSEPKAPAILVAPSTPLWFHGLRWALLGAGLAFFAVFAAILLAHRRAVPLAAAFRASAEPILQHRLEQRAWPEAFPFAKPSEAIQRYKFSEAWDKLASGLEVPGEWSFAPETQDGLSRGVILFRPADPAVAEPTLRSADQRLDDGQPGSGRFRRRADGAWGLTLSVE
jgi:hypothetical protein